MKQIWTLDDMLLFTNLETSGTGILLLNTESGQKMIGVGDTIIKNEDGTFDKLEEDPQKGD